MNDYLHSSKPPADIPRPRHSFRLLPRLLRRPLTLGLLLLPTLFLAETRLQALIVGFNVDVHNGTGQDAYDFHVFGILRTREVPVQVAEFHYGDPGWDYEGSQFTPIQPYVWLYQGVWSGTDPIPHCSVMHVGKYFDVPCVNAIRGFYGYWTDADGRIINPLGGTRLLGTDTWYSDVPLLGFEVNDPTRTLTLDNATTEPISVRGYQLAVSSTLLPLSQLVRNSPSLDALSWVNVGDFDVASGGANVINLDDYLASGRYLYMRGMMYDPLFDDYVFWAQVHEAPDSSVFGVGALCFGALLAAGRTRAGRSRAKA